LCGFDLFNGGHVAVINGVDLVGGRDIVLISGPFLERGASEGSLKPLEALDRRVERADLCGRSWQGEPKDVYDLILNTFKPIFCEGREGEGRSPSEMFLDKVNWSILAKDGSILPMGEPERFVSLSVWGDQVSMARLLVIASTHATKALLGGSIRRLYLYHSQRNVQNGGSPLFLRDIVPLFSSPLESLNEDVQARIELAILPDPAQPSRYHQYYADDERDDATFSELRINYLRRVHFTLGCEQHAIW
jgi:hypothetical protein